MIYLTFAEQPSGVYAGQVVDVCKYLDEHSDTKVRLLAFFSIRGFWKTRKSIKKKLPGAIILPMFPRLSSWKWNAISLWFALLLTGERNILCRNVLAANLALQLKRTGLAKIVGYDGRGAMAAEWREYHVVENTQMRLQIFELEKRAVLESDFRISVSSRLIHYWKDEFGYHSENHVIIPCTLSQHFILDLASKDDLIQTRKALNWKPDDIGMVYAGSTAGWQSFERLSGFLRPALQQNPKIKVLFLSKLDENNKKLQQQFPDQVQIKWLNPVDVQKYMSACDYGLLLRDKSVTNKVAAPTKFAEYLACGLSVVISDELGDYSDFVREHECGVVIDDEPKVEEYWQLLTAPERKKNNQLARSYFTKSSDGIKKEYERLMSEMT